MIKISCEMANDMVKTFSTMEGNLGKRLSIE